MAFTSLLIANRGEIAVRIMRTTKEMGIRTIAVYSEADRDALHVQCADEALEIGPAPASQSYLKIENVLAAAQKSGAEAIHPGYGFLAENSHFNEVCRDCNIDFIGPSPEAMLQLGAQIARTLQATPETGVVIYLHGDLGAGKTTLVRAILQNLGVSGLVWFY